MIIRKYLVFLLFLLSCPTGNNAEPEPESEPEPYPKAIGEFKNSQHQVSGKVYILDDKKIQIKNFKYDGSAPDALFYIGKKLPVSEKTGMVVQFAYTKPAKIGNVLGPYDGEDITLTLPGDMSSDNIKWLSVWCREFGINFGDVEFLDTKPVPEIDENSIYTGCSGTKATKGCFGFPSGCVKDRSCDMMTTYAFNPQTKAAKIELTKRKLKDSQYVAMAFSFDNSMGDDLVFSCTAASDPVRIGWNIGTSGPSRQPQGINVQSKSYTKKDDEYVCSFTIIESMTFTKPGSTDTVTFDLKEKLFILMATGPKSNGEIPGYHSTKISSAESIDLKSASAVKAAASNEYFYQIHGAVMVLAWIGCASTGMVMARYYKETWKNIKPLKKDLWFRVHQIFMSLVVLMSIAAFIVICTVKGFLPYSIQDIKNNPHPATGFASILCALAQPIMAYFRPHPGTSKRWVFDWLHWFVGNSAFLLGLSTLFLAVDLPAAKLEGRNVEIALLIYVILHVIAHLLLTIQHCKAKRNNVNGYEYPQDDPNQDMKGASFRKILALMYFVFVWIVAVSVVIIIFQKASENHEGDSAANAEPEGVSSEPEGVAEAQSGTPEVEPLPESEGTTFAEASPEG